MCEPHRHADGGRACTASISKLWLGEEKISMRLRQLEWEAVWGRGFGGISLQHHIKNLLKKTKKLYNTNKKVIQYSGIQCVSWDETTAGEKLSGQKGQLSFERSR